MDHRIIVLMLSVDLNINDQLVPFKREAGEGGLPENDNEFPFAGDVDILRRSLRLASWETSILRHYLLKSK